MDGAVSGVGVTALAVAAARAIETARPDRTTSDPYAEHFVRAARPDHQLPATPAEVDRLHHGDARAWGVTAEYIGIRTRFFDDFLMGASGSGIRQTVILAAGLDMRALRLSWPPGHTTYELDDASLLGFKDSVLADHGTARTARRRVVAVDLRDDWQPALRAAGFDPNLPTAWLAEGLLPYLPPTAEQELLRTINALSAPGSSLAAEQLALPDPDAATPPTPLGAALQLGVDIPALIHHDHRAQVSDLLGMLGWHVTVDLAGDVARSYGATVDQTCQARRLITARHNPGEP